MSRRVSGSAAPAYLGQTGATKGARYPALSRRPSTDPGSPLLGGPWLFAAPSPAFQLEPSGARITAAPVARQQILSKVKVGVDTKRPLRVHRRVHAIVSIASMCPLAIAGAACTRPLLLEPARLTKARPARAAAPGGYAHACGVRLSPSRPIRVDTVCQSKAPPPPPPGTTPPGRSFLSLHGTNQEIAIARTASLRNGLQCLGDRALESARTRWVAIACKRHFDSIACKHRWSLG